MLDFRWIKMSLILILLLQFTAAATGQSSSRLVAKAGDDVTLPCENLKGFQEKCGDTNWIFTRNKFSSELVILGQINENAKADRLSITANCSLVQKKVTVKDVGVYTCRQSYSGDFKDAHVHLFVVTLTEQKEGDKVMLSCSVWTPEWCIHTVKWLYEGKDVDKGNKEVETSQSECSAAVTFPSSSLKQNYGELLECKVTDKNIGKVVLFALSLQSSGENATTNAIPGWLRFVIVSVGLTALIVSVVTVNIWTRTKGKKTQMDGNDVCYNDYEDYNMMN